MNRCASVRYAARNANLGTRCGEPHNGLGAHGAPARERRGAWGPRERPSRGPGRSRGLVDLFLKAAAVILLGASLATGAASLSAGEEQSVNRDRNGLAIDGYDPVAYFVEGRPVQGLAEFEHTWNGTRYRFATAANRDRFVKDPEAFAPQYGGFCAYAVSRGYTADIDPVAWTVVNGRLYLNYSVRVQRTWEGDVPGNIKKADANWVTLREKGK